MRKVIRSLMWTDPAEKPLATLNYKATRKDRLTNLLKTEEAVLDYVLEYYVLNNEPPDLRTVFDAFTRANRPEEVTLVEESGAEAFYQGAGYLTLFEAEVEDQACAKLHQACKEAVKIAQQGVKVNGSLVKGVDAAVAYLFSNVEGKPVSGEGKVPANLRKTGTALVDLYTFRKNNPDRTYGVHMGYGMFDHSTLGARKKSLVLLAGFNGHLKSTLIFNMMINSSVAGGWNNMLFTSEMPADDVKLMLIAIHSANPMFNQSGYKPLDSQKLLVGALSPQEEDFFKLVEDDLKNNQSYGSIRVVDSGEFQGLGSIMLRATREHAEEEIDMLWVDYLTRLPVDLKYAKFNLVEARNETIIEAKRFAMAFDKGNGVALGSAFQTNREGWKRAKENEGKYDLASLSQYNAAEKEADVVSYVFYDEEERALNEPKFGMLKSRYGHVPPTPVSLYMEPNSRRMFDMSAGLNVTGSAPTMGSKSAEEEVQL